MNHANRTFNVFSWNTRGLGDYDKCIVVRNAIKAASPSVACLQETKLNDISCFKAKTFLPPNLATNWFFAPCDGSRGGILTAWDHRFWSASGRIDLQYSITTTLSSTISNCDFTLTNVYAPSDHRLSNIFLAELRSLLPLVSGPWVIIGDFNLIRSADDKNNANLNRSLMDSFNLALDQISALEIPLLGRSFTWSNHQIVPVLARLDRAFVNVDHTLTFPNTSLASLPKPTSDHVPILLTMSSIIPISNIFRFENSWLHNPSFRPSVFPVWLQAPSCSDAAGKLAACLKVTRAAAKTWARRIRAPPQIIPNCTFIIELLDFLEEQRLLSPHESQARTLCRQKLSQAIKERATYWKQRSKFKAIRNQMKTRLSTMRKQLSGTEATKSGLLNAKGRNSPIMMPKCKPCLRSSQQSLASQGTRPGASPRAIYTWIRSTHQRR